MPQQRVAAEPTVQIVVPDEDILVGFPITFDVVGSILTQEEIAAGAAIDVTIAAPATDIVALQAGVSDVPGIVTG
ncbi:MAG TPA: hypothetical protein VD978_20155 [Azospirillum sp.]|nr:hypothetical protein [Azospirillum sp.]